MRIKTFLPGELMLQRGTSRDYFALEHFHYRSKRPRTWAAVWRIVHRTDRDRIVAVGVLSWPMRHCVMRHQALAMRGKDLSQRLRFINRHVRTISRVIVHPQFRALGLASRLVRCMCRNCPTRFVEASAQMGRAHPFFEKAGMTRVNPTDKSLPVYFIFDRGR